VRKLIFLFGIILVLLFMIPLVSMANMTTESPPAITNNGNEFTLVIATPTPPSFPTSTVSSMRVRISSRPKSQI